MLSMIEELSGTSGGPMPTCCAQSSNIRPPPRTKNYARCFITSSSPIASGFSRFSGAHSREKTRCRFPPISPASSNDSKKPNASNPSGFRKRTEPDLERTLETRSSRLGIDVSVRQAILQICMHTQGHRAQCATRLRALGGTPPGTDYVLWIKEKNISLVVQGLSPLPMFINSKLLLMLDLYR